MPNERTILKRSEHGLIGGVCSGVAERFDMDVLLVRVLAVLLLVVTVGFFAVVYAAAWMVLPAATSADEAVDVDPHSFRSEVYDQVVAGVPVGMPRTVAPPASIPPTPPLAASGYYAARAATAPHAVDAGRAFAAERRQNASAGQDAAVPAKPLAVSLALGIALIALGATALLSSVFNKFSFVQLWPLACVVAGVVRIAIPAKDGSRTFTTWLGALLVMIGVIALVSSLGVYTIDPTAWIGKAGPFALVSVGLFVMGRAAKSDVLIVLAGIMMILFVLVGIFFGCREGFVEIGASLPSLPFSPELHFPGPGGGA